jgi:membrane protease YdiL (CAAX protease family)
VVIPHVTTETASQAEVIAFGLSLLLLGLLIPFVSRGYGAARSLGFQPTSLRWFAFVPAGYVVAQVISAVLTLLTEGWLGGTAHNAGCVADQMHLRVPPALVIVSACVLAPLLEETVFRGLLFATLRPRLDFTRTAGITSVLFAASQFDPRSFLPLVGVGWLLAWMRESSRSIWPPIAL